MHLAGGCAAAGFYSDRSHRRQGFVATEDNDKWDKPIPLPGLAVLNKGGFAEILSLSCPSPGSARGRKSPPGKAGGAPR